MRDLAKSAIKKLLKSCGCRISRAPANRFDAITDTLELLHSYGYCPRVIIDAGANIGGWTRMARQIFPNAVYHLIEPQPGCAPDLAALAAEVLSAHVHAVALTRPGVRSVFMGRGDGGTGAWIGEEGTPGAVKVPAASLDEIIVAAPEDRVLLKLDLENHEIAALGGADRLLQNVEVIISEVSFYRPTWTNGQPVFADVLRFLQERGFELYDFAALGSPLKNGRLRTGDAVFVRADSAMAQERYW
jgi:FkbM family methyltransferase